MYLINRYYNPQLGQFISVDPNLAQTLAPYAYTTSDPVIETDPTGLTPCCNGGSGWQTEEEVSNLSCLEGCWNNDYNYSAMYAHEVAKWDPKSIAKNIQTWARYLSGLLGAIAIVIGNHPLASIIVGVTGLVLGFLSLKTWIRIVKKVIKWTGKGNNFTGPARKVGFYYSLHWNFWSDSWTWRYLRVRKCANNKASCQGHDVGKVIWVPKDGPIPDYANS